MSKHKIEYGPVKVSTGFLNLEKQVAVTRYVAKLKLNANDNLAYAA